MLRENAFKLLNTFDHSAVQFKKFKGYFYLVWCITVKRKKLDLIISKDKFLHFILSMLGQRVVGQADDVLVGVLKRLID
ncbi:MAG: hypothetical protein NTZ48_00625 [Candidatus Omnitrophica bacterium]|nr:hypothetical protein [Candidatus Omnitrophota bacterium]